MYGWSDCGNFDLTTWLKSSNLPFALHSLTAVQAVWQSLLVACTSTLAGRRVTEEMPTRTFYANVANLKFTPQELVFEFGSVFPDVPMAPGKPIQFEPEVRVVMTLSALKTFADVLQKAAAAVEAGQQPFPQPDTARVTSKQ